MSTEQRNPDPIPPPDRRSDAPAEEGGVTGPEPFTDPPPEGRPTEADDPAAGTVVQDRSVAPVAVPPPAPTLRGREPVMRVPHFFSPTAPLGGWLAAWGAAALAAACLEAAGVDLGLGLGIANAQQLGVEDGFGSGLAVLIVQGGAFIFGGYVAARMARSWGLLHAGVAWVLAMLATGADAIIQGLRGEPSVVTRIPGIPYWIDTGLGGNGRLAVALAIFALAGLAGALIGGALGTIANRAARRDPVDMVETAR
jgi:hypothetical protein